MEKIFIEGINGSIEIKDLYVYIVIENKILNNREEHIIWFEKIKDIEYKKPTHNKYGYITIYFSSKNENDLEKYTIILNKNDEKNLESSEKIYQVINEIAKENNNNIVENKINENEKCKKEKPTNDYDETNKIEKREKEQKVKKYDEPKNTEKSFEGVLISSDISKNSKPLNKVDTNKKTSFTVKYKVNNELLNSPNNLNNSNNLVNKEDIKKQSEDKENNKLNLEEKSFNEEQKTNKNLMTIETLENKLHSMKKDLEIISYKEKILNKYIDETNEKEEIEYLIDEIKKILIELEKIKKNISSQEKHLYEKDFLYLLNGEVIITHINSKIYDKKEKEKLESYISTYKDTIKKIEILDKEIKDLNIFADNKKEEINITDEEYEQDVNMLKNVKTTKEFIEKYRKEAEESLKKVRHEIKTTVEEHSRLRLIRSELSNQTKLLSSFLVINSLRKGKNKAATLALLLSTGVISLWNLFGYDIKREQYNEVTTIDTLLGVDNVDVSKARNLINESEKQLDKLIKDFDSKYSNYPQYANLKKELTDLKKDIEKEDSELKKAEEQLDKYRSEEKVKILKYEQ